MSDHQIEYRQTPLARGFENIAPLFDFVQATGSHIAGGYAKYCASPLKGVALMMPTDVDVYPPDEEMFNVLESVLVEQGAIHSARTKNATTLSAPHNLVNPWKEAEVPEGATWWRRKNVDIQLIHPEEGQDFSRPENIIKNFDLSIVAAVITGPKTVLVDQDFVKDELKKKLRFRNVRCPLNAILRAMKYATRGGYLLSQGEVIHILDGWTLLPESAKNEVRRLVSRRPDVTAPNYADPRNKIENKELNWFQGLTPRKEPLYDTEPFVGTNLWHATTYTTLPLPEQYVTITAPPEPANFGTLEVHQITATEPNQFYINQVNQLNPIIA